MRLVHRQRVVTFICSRVCVREKVSEREAIAFVSLSVDCIYHALRVTFQYACLKNSNISRFQYPAASLLECELTG